MGIVDNKKQPHLAIYLGSMQKGGTERVIANLIEYFVGLGWKISLVTIFWSPDEHTVFGIRMPEHTADEGIAGGDIRYQHIYGGTSEIPGSLTRYYSEIDSYGRNRAADFRNRLDKLRRIWELLKPDAILSCMGKNNLMAIQSSHGLGIPVAVQVCAQPELEYPAGPVRISERFLFPKAAGVILQTEGSRSFFSDKVLASSVILKNIVGDAFLNADISERRDKTVIAVGRMDDNKRHAMMIEAFADIADRIPEYDFVIYGDGPDRDKLEALIDRLGMQGRIQLPGTTSDVPGVMGRASLFILASDSEGMPNTLLEAMCMGLPCISTDCPCGGPAQLIDDGENGLLIKPGDGRALSERMLNVLTDEGLSRRLGRNALKIRDVYAHDKVCGEWADYILGLMGNKER